MRSDTKRLTLALEHGRIRLAMLCHLPAEETMSFKTVFDPSFKYRRADMTDVRLTFARIRREQKSAQRRVQAQVSAKVVGRIVPAEPCHWPFPVGAMARAGDAQA